MRDCCAYTDGALASYVVTDLTNGTEYAFKARARDVNDVLVGTALGAVTSTPSEAAGWHDIPCDSPCVPARQTSYTLTGLTAGTQYVVQVAPVEQDNSSEDRPLAAVGEWSFTAFNGVNNTETLTWADPDNNTIEKYQYRTKAGTANFGNWTDIANSDNDTVSYDAGLPPSGRCVSWKCVR